MTPNGGSGSVSAVRHDLIAARHDAAVHKVRNGQVQTYRSSEYHCVGSDLRVPTPCGSLSTRLRRTGRAE
jgi:hypothetical protein